jgi:hypothetical protein
MVGARLLAQANHNHKTISDNIYYVLLPLPWLGGHQPNANSTINNSLIRLSAMAIAALHNLRLS